MLSYDIKIVFIFLCKKFVKMFIYKKICGKMVKDKNAINY